VQRKPQHNSQALDFKIVETKFFKNSCALVSNPKGHQIDVSFPPFACVMSVGLF
jgi:hypothetical protein